MSIEIPEPASPSNPHIGRISVIEGDIAAQAVDMVVAAIPRTLEYKGHINTALMEGAGHPLDQFLRENTIDPRPGDVYAIPGFGLNCKHILFCIVPYWRIDIDRHDRILLNACRRAMETAREMSLSTIAFPPLLSGRMGYPKARAARLIVSGICDRLDENFEEVRIVCRTHKNADMFRERLSGMGWIKTSP